MIAEGIESEFLAAHLRELGCAEGQGFYYGGALSGNQLRSIMAHPGAMRWTGTGTAQVA